MLVGQLKWSTTDSTITYTKLRFDCRLEHLSKDMLRSLKALYTKAIPSVNCRVQESDGNFFESFSALAWKQQNKRLRAVGEVSESLNILRYYFAILPSFWKFVRHCSWTLCNIVSMQRFASWLSSIDEVAWFTSHLQQLSQSFIGMNIIPINVVDCGCSCRTSMLWRYTTTTVILPSILLCLV